MMINVGDEFCEQVSFSNMFQIQDIAAAGSGFVRDGTSSVILKARVLADNFEISNPGVAEIMKKTKEYKKGLHQC